MIMMMIWSQTRIEIVNTQINKNLTPNRGRGNNSIIKAIYDNELTNKYTNNTNE